MGSDTNLEKRVAELEAKIAELEAGEHDSAGISRRGALGLGGLIGASGLLGLGATSAAAASGSVGTDANPVDVHASEVRVAEALAASALTDGRRIESLVGPNLQVNDANELESTASGGGDGDLAATEGIATTRRNVGPVVGGGYHDSLTDNGGYGVVFEAEDLTIRSVVVDADLSGGGSTTVPVELRQYGGGTADTVVESTTITVSGGPERVPLDFHVPPAGANDADANNEYILARGAQPNNSTPLRRLFGGDGDWSLADYEEHTYDDPTIDFRRGDHTNADGVGEESWYYFFDWLVGPEETRVEAPWSTDVDEIYMRSRDPEEEFDDVSPRAIWFDPSE